MVSTENANPLPNINKTTELNRNAQFYNISNI